MVTSDGGPSIAELLAKDSDGLRSVFLRWDPIGTQSIDDPGPPDEYDCLIGPTIGKLARGTTQPELAAHLGHESKDHFGLGTGQPELDVASQVVEWATGTVVHKRGYVVLTERLGMPKRNLFGLFQSKLTYERQPREPTATCHVQMQLRGNVACGYEWEGLVEVPGYSNLQSVSADLRCDECWSAIDPSWAC